MDVPMKLRACARVAIGVAGALLAGCGESGTDWLKDDARFSGAAWTDPAPHRRARMNVNDTALAYLDWGFQGRPLILIHGLGENAHIFDDLAALLKDDFRVIAYTRRGHGESEESWEGYDIDTLCEDLREFVDRGGFERVTLLGWGTGGNEITRFAQLHPERVGALVYLDAGYDFSDPSFVNSFQEMLAVESPGAAESASLDAYRAWTHASWVGRSAWSAGLEAFVRSNVTVGAGGVVAPRMVPRVRAASLDALAATPRNYEAVKAPALALYAERFFPEDPRDAAKARRVREWEARVMAPFRKASMERVKRELTGSIVREIAGTTHVSIGAGAPVEAARAIREFLEKAPAAPTAPPAPPAK